MYPNERFNSWVTRQVLNRRFPESTVIETYRLSEWAHFMETSDQLPEGATLTRLTAALDFQEPQNRDPQSGDKYELSKEQLAQMLLVYDCG